MVERASDPADRSRDVLEWMRADWDQRAHSNARHYIATGCETWTDDDFFASGRECVEQQILTDMENICGPRNPKDLRILEIGCGAGRLTQALAHVFGEVHGVDISGQMISQGRENLKKLGIANAHLYHNNGQDLSVIPSWPFHFAFSWITFQHIPSKDVIESYIREVHRLLVPGSLFKFQTQGFPLTGANHDTWTGVSFTLAEMTDMAARCDFEYRYHHGEGTQEFLNWFFRI